MRDETRTDTREDAGDFARAAEKSQTGIVREFWDFICHYKKWWLIPIVVLLLLAGTIAVLSGTVLAPFIYTIF